LSDAFATIVDCIIGLTMVEAGLLAVYHRRTGRGVAPADFLINLTSGLFLMLALRLALTSAWWGWITLCLTAAGAAHVTDLRRRWKK
jgi:hypothetical protein